MVRPFLGSILAAAAALGLAPPAAANEGPLLELQSQFAFLTADQLLREGYWACRAARSGMGSSDIVPMVQQHLKYSGASLAVANKIVSTAIVHLDC
ncbi:DUF732 domain-containing protein [Mycolicibacterium monacense]|uniref:DUF732 domain-containing protein n=1 Tax=Mycolicibacterium monacense TaxID=85693 RepID=A0AAD1MZY7_MYCMB|nr:DUF732 domain-containing protein [Mycolicibacterium monacense]MDA4104182.1 hypothetical protein [Mycolicibacterium monacense DSM 44395]OBF47075.1 DUF732 domain-containing protein [Mycolicibacterium monacense]ORB15960.1 DUF732 domain-containing protein [Mycolicibacterium monacense DSM 44395]QHP85046.1 DUF732 domain-containing protein [Mycolicibacterium monacense DSM 44395]BBZ62124.1 hypothetical protein MMON_34250 [Mycolicibacterium monacense]